MKKGFTLIELLVAIAIIGILASLTIVMMGDARGDARDARRKTDLVQTMTAIELYKSLEGSSPTIGTCPGDGIIADNAGKLCGGSIFQSATKVYIQRLPQDPQGGDYDYQIGYTITANLENGNQFICQNTACNEQ